MKKIGFSIAASVLEIDLKVDFIFKNSHVFTISKREYKKVFPSDRPTSLANSSKLVKNLPEWKERAAPFGYLIVASCFEYEVYDRVSEGAAIIRPQLLIIHGILTFFTQRSFTPFQNESFSYYEIANHLEYKKAKPILKLGKANRSNALAKVLDCIQKENEPNQILIYGLLERWRKALYLEGENKESYIYDESILVYFHILEILSNEYKHDLQTKVDQEKLNLYDEMLQIFENGKNPEQKKSELRKIHNLILCKSVGVREKIFNMLAILGLDNEKSRNIVERFNDHRNAIAHGRKNIYHPKAIFPLRPFFSLVQDINENVEAIRILTAKVIAVFLGINLWDREWQYLMFTEPTPYKRVKEFIEKVEYKKLSIRQLANGAHEEITPQTLTYYYLKSEKEVTLLKLEEILEDLLLSIKITKRNSHTYFDAALILADSSNQKLAEKSRRIVIQIYKNDWGFYSNIRDVLKEYEYAGRNLVWLKKWLTDGKPIALDKN